MATVFCQITHIGFDEPRRAASTADKAFNRGFSWYFLTKTVGDRTPESRDRKARYRYQKPSLRCAFQNGWDEAHRQSISRSAI